MPHISKQPLFCLSALYSKRADVRKCMSNSPAEASAIGAAYNELGTKYEIHAINEERKANSNGRITFSAENAPLPLLAHVRCQEKITVKSLRECLELCKQAENNPPENKKRSSEFGFDGVSVSLNAWLENDVDGLLIKMLEAKSTANAIDCCTLGSQLALMWRLRDKYGVDSPQMPKLRLLATHEPTAELKNTFKKTPKLFEFAKIAFPDEHPAVAVALFELRTWQRTAVRQTIVHLRPKQKQHGDTPKRAAKIDVACGGGKTYTGILILKEADWANVKIFVVNKPGLAGQVQKAANPNPDDLNSKPGIKFIDLTCNHRGTITPVVDASDELEENEGEEKNGVKDAKSTDQCNQILELLEDHAKRATKDEPVYLILCQYTLRYLMSTKVVLPGPETKDGRKTAIWGERTSEWDELMARLPLVNGKKQQFLVVIDEWHKIQKCKDIFDGLFADPDRCRTVFMTGTEYDASSYEKAIGKTNTTILKNATTTGRLTIEDGIKLGYLVRGHAETVYAVDSEGKQVHSSKASIDDKVKQAATWMVANSLHTAVVYCHSIDEATKVEEKMEVALEEAAKLKSKDDDDDAVLCTAWSGTVHSNKKNADNKATLTQFQAPKTLNTPDFRVVTSVAMLEEGFDYPALDACILFAVPKIGGRLMQMIQRCMRASPGKALGRILLFGDDNVASHVAKLLSTYDRQRMAISLGATPATLQGYVDVWTNTGDARKNCVKAAEKFKNDVNAKIVDLGTRDERVVAQFEGFLGFIEKHQAHPSRKFGDYCKRTDAQLFTFKVNGGEGSRYAYCFYTELRRDFHKELASCWLHTEELRNKARNRLPFWIKDPPKENPHRPQTELALDVRKFHANHGRLPVRGAEDGLEKQLAIFLHNLFTPANKERFQHSLGGAEQYDDLCEWVKRTRASEPSSREKAAATKRKAKGLPEPTPEERAKLDKKRERKRVYRAKKKAKTASSGAGSSSDPVEDHTPSVSEATASTAPSEASDDDDGEDGNTTDDSMSW